MTRSRFRAALLVWTTAVAVTISACGGSSGARAAGASVAAAGWATIATFTGPGGAPLDTGSFTVSGGKVRFRYTVQHNDTGPVPFLWQMFKQGTPVSPNELARDQCVSCDGPQANDLGTVPAGSYYLHVITSRPWTLTIEENR